VAHCTAAEAVSISYHTQASIQFSVATWYRLAELTPFQAALFPHENFVQSGFAENALNIHSSLWWIDKCTY